MKSSPLTTLVGCAVAAVLCSPHPAHATCSISASSVSFGAYDVFASAPLDSTGSVTFNCTANEKNISIMLNTGSSGSFSARTMRKTGETLNYNLYLDAARSIIWGDGTGGTQYYFDKNPPNKKDVVVTIYARTPAGQDAATGSYTDTITATINF